MGRSALSLNGGPFYLIPGPSPTRRKFADRNQKSVVGDRDVPAEMLFLAQGSSIISWSTCRYRRHPAGTRPLGIPTVLDPFIQRGSDASAAGGLGCIASASGSPP
jgi:hypothetical protein